MDSAQSNACLQMEEVEKPTLNVAYNSFAYSCNIKAEISCHCKSPSGIYFAIIVKFQGTNLNWYKC